MSCGHELRWGNDGLWGGTRKRGKKRRKQWDNCNSINTKTYFLKRQGWRGLNVEGGGVGRARESKGGEMGTPVIEQHEKG